MTRALVSREAYGVRGACSRCRMCGAVRKREQAPRTPYASRGLVPVMPAWGQTRPTIFGRFMVPMHVGKRGGCPGSEGLELGLWSFSGAWILELGGSGQRPIWRAHWCEPKPAAYS